MNHGEILPTIKQEARNERDHFAAPLEKLLVKAKNPAASGWVSKD
jgi:hypothetical protein